MIHRDLSRRAFVARASLAGAAATIGSLPWSLQAASGEQRFKIIAFSKPFRTLNAAQTAELVADVGWDGIELPVRANIGIHTQPISFIGLPVVAVPIPLVPMPIGVQIIAAPWREDIALRVAHALERAGVATAPLPRGL